MKTFIIFFCSTLIIIAGIFISNNKLLNNNYSLIFNEFIQSSDFHQLLEDNIHTFNYRVSGGTYNLGLPISAYNESVYGTNRGTRTVPLLFLFYLLQKIFGTMWDRIYLLFILIAPLIGYWFTLKFFSIKLDKLSMVVSTLFFAFNPWIFSRLETGFWQLHISYACLPFIYFAFNSLWDNKNNHLRKKTIIVSILILSLIFYFQPHFLIMICIPLFLIYIYKIFSRTNQNSIRYVFSTILIIFIGFFIVNAYQIIPSLLHSSLFITTQGQYFSLAAVRFNGTGSTLIDIFGLSPRSPLDQNKSLHFLNYLNYGFFISILSFLFCYFISERKNIKKFKKLFFYIGIIIFFIFIAKGLNYPFIGLSELIYDRISFMHFFRDPSRFYSVIALFLSFILLKNISDIKLKKIFYLFFLVFFFVYIFFASKNLGLKFNYIQIPHQYNAIKINAKNDRLALIPDNLTLDQYNWFSGNNTGDNNSPFVALVPLNINLANFSGTGDSYFSELIFYSQNQYRNNKEFASLFNRLDIDYILVDNNIKKTFTDYDVITKSAQLLKNSQYSIITQKNNIDLYKKNKKNQFFLDKTPIFLIDNLDGFNELNKKIDSSIPIILLNQSNNLKEFIDKKINKEVIIYRNKDEIDNLFLNLLDKYSLHLEKYVWNYDKKWFLYEPYLLPEIDKGIFFTSGRSIAATINNAEFSFQYNTKPGDYVVAIDSLKDNVNGKIKLTINGKKFISDNKSVTLSWKNLGSIHLKNKNIISISNVNNDLAIIDDLLIIPKDNYLKEKDNYNKVLRQNSVMNLSEFKSKEKQSNLAFSQKNYSTWDLNSKNKWITMNFPFDTGWQISKQKAQFIGNYYGMTFLTTDNNKKIISYKFEDIFQKLLVVSIFFVIILLFILLF